MNFHLSPISSNEKTGPIPVTTTGRKSCPDACPFKAGGCYAENYYLSMHWTKVDSGKRGGNLSQLVEKIRNFPAGQLWRHNQAGDLPGSGDNINRRDLLAIAKANKGKRGWTYTHKPPTAKNLSAIREASREGFTINLSGNSLAHADRLSRHRLPVVAVLPSDAVKHKTMTSPAGRRVIVCPATRLENVTCATCGLCQRANRDYIIGFPAHGTQSKKANAIANK